MAIASVADKMEYRGGKLKGKRSRALATTSCKSCAASWDQDDHRISVSLKPSPVNLSFPSRHQTELASIVKKAFSIWSVPSSLC